MLALVFREKKRQVSELLAYFFFLNAVGDKGASVMYVKVFFFLSLSVLLCVGGRTFIIFKGNENFGVFFIFFL